jgi:hypothetical protein
MMSNRAQGKEELPTDRLERWLVGTLQEGVLKGLPRYRPLRGVAGVRPEMYAQMLLEGLRSADTGPGIRERIKDDGRAFRGWAEMAPSARPRAGGARATA